MRRQTRWEGPVSSCPFSGREETFLQRALWTPAPMSSGSTSSAVPGTEEVPSKYLLNK